MNFSNEELYRMYFNEHYRVEIEVNGRLLEFNPYNNAEEKDIDK